MYRERKWRYAADQTDYRPSQHQRNFRHLPRPPGADIHHEERIWRSSGDEYETYEAMVENAAIDTAISEAEAEFERDGQLHDAREALASLRRKHFG